MKENKEVNKDRMMKRGGGERKDGTGGEEGVEHSRPRQDGNFNAPSVAKLVGGTR